MLPGKPILFQVVAQRNFEHQVQFEAYYNSRPNTSFFHDNASKKKKKKQFLPNQETREKQGLWVQDLVKPDLAFTQVHRSPPGHC